ncbi:MAG: [protein-PII] uridylyltransferase [Acidimicrobiales bacterium]
MALRQSRQRLVDHADLSGEEFCRSYSAEADAWLTDLFDQATQGNHRGLALVAVGGYGRSELCPYSDLDVVLVHRGNKKIAALADRIWYPVWDEGIALDHSVRRPPEVLELASRDMRVALGLLDARVVCGDREVAEPVITGARSQWIRQRPAWLGDLSQQVDERHRSFGDVGFLIEPDLKEAHGGLRDVSALAAVMLAVPVLADFVDTGAVDRARANLIRVRVELHRRAGREQNTLLLQEQDEVAAALGMDSDTLMSLVASAGRTVAWECDDAWRRRGVWSRQRTGRWRERVARLPIEGRGRGSTAVRGQPGIAVFESEVGLTSDAQVVTDFSLSLRLALVAAERDLPIARDALNLLGRKAPQPPQPWPAELRATFVSVLAAGPPAVGALESLDQRRLLERYLPEWSAVRNRPQRNPYHRYTVDRHLLETTANAALSAHRVDRPDLLLLGTLLHDIGKGFPGDHTQAGMVVVEQIGTRIGLERADVDVLIKLVQLHLLLPDMATRRDLDDPATAERVAKEVGDRQTLDLLVTLVEADSRATGPSAWSGWKAGLVTDLVERTRRLLAGEEVDPPRPWITDDLRWAIDTVRERGTPALSIHAPEVTVVSPDRPGLLAEVTGVLALHGLDVRSAVVSEEDGIAVEVFTAEPSRGTWPDSSRIADDLASLADGTLSVDKQLAERAQIYRGERRATRPQLVSTQVTVDNNASARATVVEVRAEDVIGQLHRITQALVDLRLDVISAKVSTFGSAVVDAFYVRGPDGAKITEAGAISALDRQIRLRITAQSRPAEN